MSNTAFEESFEEFKAAAVAELNERLVPRFECLEGTEFFVSDDEHLYGIWHTKNGEDGYYVGHFTGIEMLRRDLDYILEDLVKEFVEGDAWIRTFFTAARWRASEELREDRESV